MKNNLKYNPKAYTLSALIIGYLLIGDYSALEQNAIGNWFITIGQILECNSAIQQNIEQILTGSNININSKEYKNNKTTLINLMSKEELNNINKVLNNILDKINTIKK